MEDTIFDIKFIHDGKLYKGWVNPSDQLGDSGQPLSFHVVLDNVSFGHLSFDKCNWNINEERPKGLVKAIGKEIEKYYSF